MESFRILLFYTFSIDSRNFCYKQWLVFSSNQIFEVSAFRMHLIRYIHTRIYYPNSIFYVDRVSVADPNFASNHFYFVETNHNNVGAKCFSFFCLQAEQLLWVWIYFCTYLLFLVLNSWYKQCTNIVQTMMFVDKRFIYLLYQATALHVDTCFLKRQALWFSWCQLDCSTPSFFF